MFAARSIARSRVLGVVAAQLARASASTLQGNGRAALMMASRYQSTQTAGAEEVAETGKPQKDSAPTPERRVDPVLVEATKELKSQLDAGATTKELIDDLFGFMDQLTSIGSRIKLGSEVAIPIMQKAVAEINDPNQTSVIPTPLDILNKLITYTAAPHSAFQYVSSWLIRDGQTDEVLPLWVSFLEYKANARYVNRETEGRLVRMAFLTFLESVGADADRETIERLLQSKIPDAKSCQGELKRLFPVSTPRSKKLQRTIENFFLKTRDPNSIQSLTNAFEAANMGRSQPVFNALSTARKISRVSGKPLEEETIVAFMKMFNRLSLPNESMKLWNDLISAGVSPSTQAWNALLQTASKAGPRSKRLGQVEAIRSKIPTPDEETDSVLIQIYARAKHLSHVEDIVQNKNLESSPLIAQSYVQALCINNQYTKLQETLTDFKQNGIKLNTETFNNILSLLSRSKRFGEVRALLDEMTAAGIVPDVATYTILIDIKLKVLRVNDEVPTPEVFELFFEELKTQGIEANEFTLTAIMDGLFKIGAVGNAQSLFKYLQTEGRASLVTYISIITGEFNNRLVKEAEAHFKELLSEGYQLYPQNWAALFEGFCHNGQNVKCLEYLNTLDSQNQTKKLLNRFSYYFIIRTARDQQDEILAQKIFEIIVKNSSESILTPTTLLSVKDLRERGVAIPESILALL